MRKLQPESGEGILAETLNSLDNYLLVTMKEPLILLSPELVREPPYVIHNLDMRIPNLEYLVEDRLDVDRIVGFGGGTSCDTAKFLSWKWGVPLIISPSIVSVDAWLCSSIAVRNFGKVQYVGNVIYEKALVDYSIIKKAPPELNRAGVADVVSICTALGDWKIAGEMFGEEVDEEVFDAAKAIADELLEHAAPIRDVTSEGIDALVKGQWDEMGLCEKFGSARPEEGSEHYLAYRLEEITRRRYIHGNLIALNVLAVLKLQREFAVYDIDRLKKFFDDAGLRYRPREQDISRGDYARALASMNEFVENEGLSHCLWSVDDIFDDSGDYSVDGIVDWLFSI